MNGKPDCRTGITRRVLLAVALALFLQAPLSAQNQARLEVPQAALSTRLQSGVGLYGRGMWPEALAELRRAYLEGTNPSQKAEALYWIAMTELGAAHYEESVRAMDELQRLAPGNTRYAEVPYHRGRVYYYLGRFDEAIVLFRSFIDSIAVDVPGENARKPAALYWMGECL
ncbi:MAG: tetratricopeptide repeat protein, partial [Spirochaetaceae bacterium]|nr:tetratricopeptide repeat protein [Spirochaetaceae bacterium]